MGDVVKGVIKCIWLNLRYGLERTSVTKNGLESGCVVRNSERYFPYWWPLTGVNECICWKFMSFWVDFWRFSRLKSRMNERCQKFVTFGVRKCGKFVLFWILDEFSAWSRELQWRCRISFPSVTGRCEIRGEYTSNLQSWAILWCITDTPEVYTSVLYGLVGRRTCSILKF